MRTEIPNVNPRAYDGSGVRLQIEFRHREVVVDPHDIGVGLLARECHCPGAAARAGHVNQVDRTEFFERRIDLAGGSVVVDWRRVVAIKD
jgi:hypothetical protein